MTTAIYLRSSLDRDRTKVSVEYQREHLVKLCTDKSWPTPVEYMDRSVSATTGRREAYEQLCADIAAGNIARVAVWDLDRLHRQPRELEDFIDLAESHGVELANVSGDVDLSTPSGRMFARVKGGVAKYEVEQKSARQKAANRKRAERGKAWQSRTFGRDGDNLVAVEAAAIREAAAAVINGQSLRSIAVQWNRDGLTTTKGGPWSGSSVRQMLMRPSNAGLVVYDGQVVEGVKATFPAIVDRDVYDAVLAVLADPIRHTGKSIGRVHLGSGLYRCGACGRGISTLMRKTRKGEKVNIYACKHLACGRVARTMARVDEVVIDVVCGWLAQPKAAAIFAPPTVNKKKLLDEANVLRAKMAQTKLDYDEDLIDARDRNRKLEKLQAQLDPIEAKLLGANLSHALNGLAGNPKAREAFEALTLDRKRAVIAAACDVIIRPTKAGERFDPEKIKVTRKQASAD